MGKLTAATGAATLIAAAVPLLGNWPPSLSAVILSAALGVLALFLIAWGAWWDRREGGQMGRNESSRPRTIGILDQGVGTVITDSYVSGFDEGISFQGRDARASRNVVDGGTVRVIALDQGFVGTDGVNHTAVQQSWSDAYDLAARGVWET